MGDYICPRCDKEEVDSNMSICVKCRVELNTRMNTRKEIVAEIKEAYRKKRLQVLFEDDGKMRAILVCGNIEEERFIKNSLAHYRSEDNRSWFEIDEDIYILTTKIASQLVGVRLGPYRPNALIMTEQASNYIERFPDWFNRGLKPALKKAEFADGYYVMEGVTE